VHPAGAVASVIEPECELRELHPSVQHAELS
jgi:hypothetical protein